MVYKTGNVRTVRGNGVTIQVEMDDECLSYNKATKTCVRPTTDGRFAIISTIGDRLYKVLDTENAAVSYHRAMN